MLARGTMQLSVKHICPQKATRPAPSMTSLFLGGALGLAVQPLQAGSMQASPDPSPAAQAGAGVDWATGAALPVGATAVPLAPAAPTPVDKHGGGA